MKKLLSILCVFLAATCWGCLGLFLRNLQGRFGITPLEASFLRSFSAALMFLVMAACRGIRCLRVSPKRLPVLALSGFFGITVTSVAYLISMANASLSVAATLMYTAPAIVAVASVILFRERPAPAVWIALALALLGTVCSSGILGGAQASVYGVLMGILSGVAYASYSIFGTYALRHNDAFCVTAWSFIFSAVGVLFFVNVPTLTGKLFAVQGKEALLMWGLILGMGFFSTFFAFLVYTVGLSGLGPSRASLLASMEPAIAAFVGFLAFGEKPTLFTLLGMVLILSSVAITSLHKKES